MNYDEIKKLPVEDVIGMRVKIKSRLTNRWVRGEISTISENGAGVLYDRGTTIARITWEGIERIEK